MITGGLAYGRTHSNQLDSLSLFILGQEDDNYWADYGLLGASGSEGAAVHIWRGSRRPPSLRIDSFRSDDSIKSISGRGVKIVFAAVRTKIQDLKSINDGGLSVKVSIDSHNSTKKYNHQLVSIFPPDTQQSRQLLLQLQLNLTHLSLYHEVYHYCYPGPCLRRIGCSFMDEPPVVRLPAAIHLAQRDGSTLDQYKSEYPVQRT